MALDMCNCGIEYNNEKPLENLEMVITKSVGNKHPCRICVDRIITNTTRQFKICLVCEKTCLTNTHLREHILSIHIRSAPYKCVKCGKRCKIKRGLKRHMKIHNGNNNRNIIKCQFCDQLLEEGYLMRHIEQFHSKIPPVVLCHVCGLLCKSRGNKQVYEGKMYKCSDCEKESPASEIFPVSCEICNKMISSKKNLFIHMRNMHTVGNISNRSKYPCQNCDKIFKTKKAVTEHRNSVHNIIKVIYTCKVCGKTFSRSAAYYRHQVIHTGVRKYACDMCGDSFNQKCTLTRHQVVHTGEKPFECGICGQRFTQKPYMKVHEKKHKEGEVVTKKEELSEESDEDMSKKEECMTEGGTSEEIEENSGIE